MAAGTVVCLPFCWQEGFLIAVGHISFYVADATKIHPTEVCGGRDVASSSSIWLHVVEVSPYCLVG